MRVESAAGHGDGKRVLVIRPAGLHALVAEYALAVVADVQIIVELYRLGVAPEEMPSRLPHLKLAQVFDALSYYSDHQAEINAYIERNRMPDDLIDPLVKDS